MEKKELLTRLRLIERSPRDSAGWSKCASKIYEQLIKDTPDELVEKRIIKAEHFVRLTDEAKAVLKWV